MKKQQDENPQVIGSEKDNIIYSVPVGPKVKGETQVHRKPANKDMLIEIPSHFKSLGVFWDDRVKRHSTNLLSEDLTFIQMDEMARRVGSWIVSRGHKLFFLYCSNSPNWTITDIATWNYGLVNVPLYATLGAEAFNHILNITEGTLIFTTKNMVNSVHSFMSKNKYNVKEVCFYDEITNEERQKLQNLGLQVTSFQEALNFDKIMDRPEMNLDTQLTYGFTSGTTGIPKGVIFTHRMIIGQWMATIGDHELKPTDVYLSYLPIAHIFERFGIYACIFFGANIRYAPHPITEIFKNFVICKPTVIPIVPRLLNKFYPILKGLYEKEGNYNKIRAMFGGRLRLLVTGSAPVAPNILLFFCEALEAEVKEGYGQTQTSAGSFATKGGDRNYGHVGGPTSIIEFKLVDVPEMNYTTDDPEPKGEICVRGETVFKNYFKDPKTTAETVDQDGWNHTGDIGIILPNGALKIIDRKKNIFKLQQGEYIAPEKVENVYARCKFVAETFLYGDSLKNFNVAIIHPNLDQLLLVAQSLGIQEKDVKKLCENPKINNLILQEVTKQGKNDGLMSFEQAKKIKLWHEPFLVAGIVTNTMKIQRHIAKNRFKKEIEQLYQQA